MGLRDLDFVGITACLTKAGGLFDLSSGNYDGGTLAWTGARGIDILLSRNVCPSMQQYHRAQMSRSLEVDSRKEAPLKLRIRSTRS